MKRGKRIAVLTSLALCLSLVFSTFTFASNSVDTTEEGSSDIVEIFEHSQFVEKKDGAYIFRSDYTPSNPLRVKNNSTIKNSTTFMLIPDDSDDEATLDNLVNGKTRTFDNYRYAWDSTGGVKAYSKIVFTEETIGQYTYAYINYVQGGYEKPDNSLSVVSQVLTMGQVETGLNNQIATVNVSGNKWSVSTNYYKWQKINISQQFFHALGCNVVLTIQRRSSPWSLYLENNVYNTFAFWP